MFTTAVWNPADKSPEIDLSYGNTIAWQKAGGNGLVGVRATKSRNAGRLYFEVKCNSKSVGAAMEVGIETGSVALGDAWYDTNSVFYYTSGGQGQVYRNSTLLSQPGPYGAGDVIGVAVDQISASTALYLNNTLVYSAGFAGGQSVFPFVSLGEPGAQATLNAGHAPFVYTPPSGFSAWG